MQWISVRFVMKWWNWLDPTMSIWISVECRTFSRPPFLLDRPLYSWRSGRASISFPFSFCVCCVCVCVGPPFLRVEVPVQTDRPPLFSGRWERRQESFLPLTLSPSSLSYILPPPPSSVSVCCVCGSEEDFGGRPTRSRKLVGWL